MKQSLLSHALYVTNPIYRKVKGVPEMSAMSLWNVEKITFSSVIHALDNKGHLVILFVEVKFVASWKNQYQSGL